MLVLTNQSTTCELIEKKKKANRRAVGEELIVRNLKNFSWYVWRYGLTCSRSSKLKELTKKTVSGNISLMLKESKDQWKKNHKISQIQRHTAFKATIRLDRVAQSLKEITS